MSFTQDDVWTRHLGHRDGTGGEAGGRLGGQRNRITLLRDVAVDGHAEIQTTFLRGLNSPLNAPALWLLGLIATVSLVWLRKFVRGL